MEHQLHPKDVEVIDHINRTLQDYDMSVESMMIEGLTNAVRAGRMTETNKQEVLNEYIQKRNAGNGLPDLHEAPQV